MLAMTNIIAFNISPLCLAQTATKPFRVVVVDHETQWPVAMVELRTTHQLRFVSDNAGVIAIDSPEIMNLNTWFSVIGHGYEVPVDGFGYQGVRLTPTEGGSVRIELTRTTIAKRVGRLTGVGLFAESKKFGEYLDEPESQVFGCDSVQLASYKKKLIWAWGDTNIASYPLGIFAMTGATTSLRPFDSLEPPLKPQFKPFLDAQGRIRGMAEIPGSGPTWLTGYVSLPDAKGLEHLIAFYRKIKPPLDVYETGLCVWNDSNSSFEKLRTTWVSNSGLPKPSLAEDGHPVFWADEAGQRWLFFGNPFPRVQMLATFEAWQDTASWKTVAAPASLLSSGDDREITPQSGSIAWNEHRKRWVAVFVQKGGDSSFLGNVWYAESESPIGPWGRATKILSHDNYTFYNPRLYPEFNANDGSVLLFEGTYTATFANSPEKTPRYDYNQILYRLDLDDPKLIPSHSLTNKPIH